MARLPRIDLPGMPVHVIQRGNNRQACFASEADMAAYAHWLDEYARRFCVDIHAWVFMTNHVHLLMTPHRSGGLSKLMQALGRHYVRYFNYMYRRTGTLWEGRFKSCLVSDDAYFLICQQYIEMNPVRAGMVLRAADYKWSSFHSNGLVKPAKMWRPHPVYLALGGSASERAKAYCALFDNDIAETTLNDIRRSTNQGLILGADRFKQEVEALLGRRVLPIKRGRKTAIEDG